MIMPRDTYVEPDLTKFYFCSRLEHPLLCTEPHETSFEPEQIPRISPHVNHFSSCTFTLRT